MAMPARIGKYDIVEMIERGGMGVVYKARDSVLGRMVALKLMTTGLTDSSEGRERFLREARAVSMLQHANIVVVHEFGEHQGDPYIVMEFLDGVPLHNIIYERTPLSVPQKIDIILQVSKALQYAHQKGIVHRDIKPGNILVMRDGTVKVVDFGLAHLSGSDTITRTGVLIGTFSFMSPEQLNGEPVDARTDIFALGIVFYLLLTGKPPFEGSSAAETINKILLEPPPRLEHYRNVNQPELQPVLDKALAKEKEARYQSCAELSQDLSRLCKKFEAEAQLAELERERKASQAELGTPSDGPTLVLDAPAISEAAEVKISPPPQPPSPAKATPVADRPQSVTAKADSPPPQSSVEPASRSRSANLKWVAAGLAVLAIAGILYWRLARSGSSPALTATSAPATVPAGNTALPASSTSGPSSPQNAPITSPATPPVTPKSKPASGGAKPAQELVSATVIPPKPSTQQVTPANPRSVPEPSSPHLPSGSAKLTPEEMNRHGLAAFRRQDYQVAFAWYSEAADQGLPQSQTNLALMYEHGWGVSKDYAKAIHWLSEAANHDFARAQFQLGQCYFLGHGVAQDYKQAAEWFRKAADQGNPKAQQQLGVMYENGLGVPKDDTQAQYWFEKAKTNREQQE